MGDLEGVIRLLEMLLVAESEMAAMRRSVDDVHDMRAGLAAILRVSADSTAASEADSQFHLAIARVAKNDYFTRLWEFLGVRLVPSCTLALRGNWTRVLRTMPAGQQTAYRDRRSDRPA